MEVVPEDVVRQCLLRMPYRSHATMKTVCNRWEAILSSPTFYADRKKCGMNEQLICFIQEEEDINDRYFVTVYDPVKGTWEKLPPIDDPPNSEISVCCHCVAVNRKLLLIGGIHQSNGRLVKSVYIYDFESARWRRGADMPTARSFFACSVSSSTGLVYVAGGIDDRDIPLAAAEAYDVEKDKWEILRPMINPHSPECLSAFVEGKFMVLDERETEIFDPSEGTWRMAAHGRNFMGDLWRSCVISSSSGELYEFTDEQVEKYDVEKEVWSVVPSLPNPPRDIVFFKCGTQWRDQIFVTGVNDDSDNHISYLDFAGQIVSAATVEI